MNKFKEHMIKFKKAYLLSFGISSVAGVAVFLIFYFTSGQTLLGALNGTGVAGVLLLGAGGLCLLARLGAFDTMSYGFRQWFSAMFAREANKYNNMSDYKDQKTKERAKASYYYYVIMIVSLFFFIAFIILEIVKTKII